MLLLLAVVQTALVVRDQLAVFDASRDAARAASLGGDASEAARLSMGRGRPLAVFTSTSDGLVRVTVRYRSPTEVPFIGVFVGDVELVGSSTMALEPT